MNERLLRVNEAAALAGVSPETIRRWLRDGKIQGVKPGGPTSPYRIPEQGLLRLLSPEVAAVERTDTPS